MLGQAQSRDNKNCGWGRTRYVHKGKGTFLGWNLSSEVRGEHPVSSLLRDLAYGHNPQIHLKAHALGPGTHETISTNILEHLWWTRKPSRWSFPTASSLSLPATLHSTPTPYQDCTLPIFTSLSCPHTTNLPLTTIQHDSENHWTWKIRKSLETASSQLILEMVWLRLT